MLMNFRLFTGLFLRGAEGLWQELGGGVEWKSESCEAAGLLAFQLIRKGDSAKSVFQCVSDDNNNRGRIRNFCSLNLSVYVSASVCLALILCCE